MPLSVQADLLSVSRASLYYRAATPSKLEIAAKHRIDEIYLVSPFYGSRKIAAQMQREGYSLCRNTVAKYMKEMGNRSNLSRSEPEQTRQPAQYLSLPAARINYRETERGLGSRHHVYPSESWLDVSGSQVCERGGSAGLVLTVRSQLGTRPDAGNALRVGGGGSRSGDGSATDLEQRPRESFYQPAIC